MNLLQQLTLFPEGTTFKVSNCRQSGEINFRATHGELRVAYNIPAPRMEVQYDAIVESCVDSCLRFLQNMLDSNIKKDTVELEFPRHGLPPSDPRDMPAHIKKLLEVGA